MSPLRKLEQQTFSIIASQPWLVMALTWHAGGERSGAPSVHGGASGDGLGGVQGRSASRTIHADRLALQMRSRDGGSDGPQTSARHRRHRRRRGSYQRRHAGCRALRLARDARSGTDGKGASDPAGLGRGGADDGVTGVANESGECVVDGGGELAVGDWDGGAVRLADGSGVPGAAGLAGECGGGGVESPTAARRSRRGQLEPGPSGSESDARDGRTVSSKSTVREIGK